RTGGRGGEQSVLVVVEVCVREGQVSAFVADAGTVSVVYRSARELEITDVDVTVDNQYRLAVRDCSGRDHLDRAANTFQREVFIKHRPRVNVGAGVYLYR